MGLSELPQVQALSAREKLQLIDELWKSISGELDSLEITQEGKNMLDTRWADFLRNPARTLSIKQFKRRIAALRA